MTLRGTYRNGHVELDGGAALPDGTRVDVAPAKSESLLDIFRRNAIHDPSLPKDFASELDHYLYGHPKRNGKHAQKPATKKRAKKTARKAVKKAASTSRAKPAARRKTVKVARKSKTASRKLPARKAAKPQSGLRSGKKAAKKK